MPVKEIIGKEDFFNIEKEVKNIEQKMNKSYLKKKVYKESRSLSQSRITLKNESLDSSLVLNLDLQLTNDLKESLIIREEKDIPAKVAQIVKRHKLSKKQKRNLLELVKEQWTKFVLQV